jgi:hypothetical protein
MARRTVNDLGSGAVRQGTRLRIHGTQGTYPYSLWCCISRQAAVRIKSAFELVFALIAIIQVVTVVIILDKNRLAIVSLMDHMMGVIRNDKSTDTGHIVFTQKLHLISNK